MGAGEVTLTETIADIVSIMRSDPLYNPHNDPALNNANDAIRDYADRIEAAAKREAAGLKAESVKPTAFDEAAFDEAVSKPNGWSEVADPVAEIRRMRGAAPQGNAAAMREALMRIDRLCRVTDDEAGPAWNLEIAHRVLDEIQAALAAPARKTGNLRNNEP